MRSSLFVPFWEFKDDSNSSNFAWTISDARVKRGVLLLSLVILTKKFDVWSSGSVFFLWKDVSIEIDSKCQSRQAPIQRANSQFCEASNRMKCVRISLNVDLWIEAFKAIPSHTFSILIMMTIIITTVHTSSLWDPYVQLCSSTTFQMRLVNKMSCSLPSDLIALWTLEHVVPSLFLFHFP